MKKKNEFIFLVFVVCLISISGVAFANYKSIINGEANASIKKPVFLVNNSEIVQGQFSSIENNYYENTFSILNYIDESEINNEIDFDYTIQIVPSTIEFPVKYKLLDLETGEELLLNDNLETTKLSLGTNRELHNYKLIIEWDLENSNQNLAENMEIKIIVKGVQKNK